MEWYAGSIVEAIQSAKTSQAYFVVYIEGSDDASKTTTEVLNKSTIAGKLNGKDFVCIKLLKDSEGHQQFAAIYKMVPVPAVFFIAPQTGLATDVVVGRTDGAEVEKKILETVEKSQSTQKLEVRGATAPPVVVNAAVNPPAGAASAAEPQPSSSSTRDSVSPARSEPTREASPPSEPQPSSNSPSLDDKVEKAKQLITLKNEQKQKEELEKAKASERERRRVGQELHKAKLSRQEQEMREALEERKKNSVEEAAARKKILDQIAQDKADRLERERMRATGSTQAAPSVAASAPVAPQQPINADTARIQFRLPSGETKTHVFPAETTLTQVRQFIDNNIVLPFSEYQLATTFPRREFTWRDNEQDLRALQLLPSSVLLVLPITGSVISRPNGWATAMMSLFWSVVTPILNLGNYISSFIFGGDRRPATAPAPSSSQDAQRHPPPASAPQSSQQVPFGSRTTIRKRGNIHTLSDDSDKKDDNNTWNGNSTQQM